MTFGLATTAPCIVRSSVGGATGDIQLGLGRTVHFEDFTRRLEKKKIRINMDRRGRA